MTSTLDDGSCAVLAKCWKYSTNDQQKLVCCSPPCSSQLISVKKTACRQIRGSGSIDRFSSSVQFPDVRRWPRKHNASREPCMTRQLAHGPVSVPPQGGSARGRRESLTQPRRRTSSESTPVSRPAPTLLRYVEGGHFIFHMSSQSYGSRKPVRSHFSALLLPTPSPAAAASTRDPSAQPMALACLRRHRPCMAILPAVGPAPRFQRWGRFLSMRATLVGASAAAASAVVAAAVAADDGRATLPVKPVATARPSWSVSAFPVGDGMPEGR